MVQPQQSAERLFARLREIAPVGVAFSGGVDSAVVAKAAALADPNSMAFTARSPSLPASEMTACEELATTIGIRHQWVGTAELTRDGYRANAGNRCYFCKTELYETLYPLLDRYGLRTLVNGANADDAGDHRPGMVAATEYAVVSPLLDLGFDKATVREIAKIWDLPVWNKPAGPCLASRIAYGVEVTEERLSRIDRAEDILRSYLSEDGLPGVDLRVRLDPGDRARIEVPTDLLLRLVDPADRIRLVSEFLELGFRSVSVDLAGFRSGSANAFLPVESLTIAKNNQSTNPGTG